MQTKSLNAYLAHGHQLVKGWLFPGAPQAIVLLSEEQRRSRLSGGVAEIGVHHGKLFILLYLLSSDNELAVAIDLFSHQELNIDHSGAGDLECFKRNLCRHADTRRLVVHEGDSMQLTAAQLLELGGGPLRMISIDGGHTADITAHDLATAEGALAEGGIVLLDDCFKEILLRAAIYHSIRHRREQDLLLSQAVRRRICRRSEENGQKSCRAGVFREPGGLLQPFALDPWQVVP